VQVWQGAIAGSAPIWTFEGEHPPVDPLFYSKTVTFDTSTAAGAEEGCTEGLRAAFQVLSRLVDNAEHASGFEGRVPSLQNATRALNICPQVALNTTDDVIAVRDWASSAFDMMAMGSYPYPSSYMLNGNGLLPAFPVRVACSNMMNTLAGGRLQLQASCGKAACAEKKGEPCGRFGEVQDARGARRELRSDEDVKGLREQGCGHKHHELATDEELLMGLAAAVGVWYNYTGAAPAT
jgi:hypothetical protein